MIPPDRFARRLSMILNLCGIAIVAYYLTLQYLVDGTLGWVYALAALAILMWLADTFMPREWTFARWCVLLLMLVCSAVTAVPANGVALVPAIVALIEVTRDPRVAMTRAGWCAALAGILAVVGFAIAPIPLAGLLSIEAGFAVACLVGFSRRQHLAAELQSRELRESAMAMREEQAVVSSLAARQAAAREIHDLLAHSLGGLVLQLDAVEAQLENDDVEGALRRVHDSRALAASGLSESRRAVATLRDESEPELPVLQEDFIGGLLALMEAHRSLGGQIEFTEKGNRRSLPAPVAAATHRALQESLTNVRKHASTRAVDASLEWSDTAVALTVANSLDAAASHAATGVGHGLIGMRERFLALPGGSATAGVEGAQFVVRVRGSVA
ncbi:MAG: histidine kinase [Lacisediminihabitans sp.]